MEGERTRTCIARHCRGLILAEMGEQHRAEALTDLRESLRLAFDLGRPREVASALASLGPVLLPDARLSPASGQDRPPGPGAGPLTRTEGPFACSAACLQTAIDLHDRGSAMEEGVPRPGPPAGCDGALGSLGRRWNGLSSPTASALLQEASGLGAESWRR